MPESPRAVPAGANGRRGAPHEVIQLLHRDRAALAAGLVLPRRRDSRAAAGAVPEALPCVLLQRAENMLGVLLRLVEQRHDGARVSIVLGRPTDARPGHRLDVKIVGRNAQAGAWSRHSVKIVPLGS